MKAPFFFLALTGFGFTLFCAGLHPGGGKTSEAAQIVPKPVLVKRSGSDFILDSSTVILAGGTELSSIGEFLAGTLTAQRRLKLAIASSDRPEIKSAIVLSVDPSMSHKEGYELAVKRDRIRITGKTTAAVFYGVQTLLQLIPTRPEDIRKIDRIHQYRIPGVAIEDHSRFPWRGMHLDVCRHFFPKEFIKRYLDLMAMHKMNVFHWHLTEDQGWRIEIKKYPKLTVKRQPMAAFTPRTTSGKSSSTPAGDSSRSFRKLRCRPMPSQRWPRIPSCPAREDPFT
jgi:hexosaminidase